MSLFMDSSQEETFQTIMDYFIGRQYKILVSNSPSLIRAEIGSYMAMSTSTGTAKGDAETTIVKRNEGSYVNFNLNFTKEYIAGFLAAIVAGLIVYGVAFWIVSSVFSSSPFWSSASSVYNSLLIGGSSFAFILVMLVEGYYVSKTKTKFIAEFDRFAKSLPHKNKLPPPP